METGGLEGAAEAEATAGAGAVVGRTLAVGAAVAGIAKAVVVMGWAEVGFAGGWTGCCSGTEAVPDRMR
jgi:hypothetical protein